MSVPKELRSLQDSSQTCFPSALKYGFGPVLCRPWASGGLDHPPRLHWLPFSSTFCMTESGTLPEVPAHKALQGQGNYSLYCAGGAEAGCITCPWDKSWDLVKVPGSKP